MNYLCACDYFFGDYHGGGNRIAWELSQLMATRGHRVAMLCGSRDHDPPAGVSWVQGVRLVRYRFPRTPALNPLRMTIAIRAAASAARKHLNTIRWDIIHSHMPATGLGAFAQLGSHARRIATIHSPAVLEQRINWSAAGLAGRLKLRLGEPLLRRYERRLLEQAHDVHVLSSFTARSLADLYGPQFSQATRIGWWNDSAGARNSCTSTPTGDGERSPQRTTRTEARGQLGWTSSGPIIWTLRRFVPRMGLDVLLQALAPLIAKQKITLILAGDGPQRSRLMASYGHLIAMGGLSFPGTLSEKEVDLAYRAADLFVLPTLSLECFGLILLEALGRGQPVIASDVGAIAEIMEPILPQHLVPAGDVDGLRAKISAFLDGDLSTPSADALRTYVAANYSAKTIQASYLSLLEATKDANKNQPGEVK